VAAGASHRLDAIPEAYAGQRLDKVLAALFPQYSRSALQQWIKEGRVLVDDDIPSQKDKIHGGESVDLSVPDAPAVAAPAEAIALDIRYRDDDMLVLSKPAGLVVHPGAGNPTGTLMNALLHLDPASSRLPRAGIVHRLDKDTSGLLVVARNEPARLALIEQLASRSMRREYLALVHGDLISGRTVDEPIGRHPRNRRMMAVRRDGRSAATRLRVLRRFGAITLVRCALHSGRTHQIRVHAAHAGLPVVGDPLYGGTGRMPAGISSGLRALIGAFRRQALHAETLALHHPASGEPLTWSLALPEDFARLLRALEGELGGGGA